MEKGRENRTRSSNRTTTTSIQISLHTEDEQQQQLVPSGAAATACTPPEGVITNKPSFSSAETRDGRAPLLALGAGDSEVVRIENVSDSPYAVHSNGTSTALPPQQQQRPVSGQKGKLYWAPKGGTTATTTTTSRSQAGTQYGGGSISSSNNNGGGSASHRKSVHNNNNAGLTVDENASSSMDRSGTLGTGVPPASGHHHAGAGSTRAALLTPRRTKKKCQPVGNSVEASHITSTSSTAAAGATASVMDGGDGLASPVSSSFVSLDGVGNGVTPARSQQQQQSRMQAQAPSSRRASRGKLSPIKTSQQNLASVGSHSSVARRLASVTAATTLSQLPLFPTASRQSVEGGPHTLSPALGTVNATPITTRCSGGNGGGGGSGSGGAGEGGMTLASSATPSMYANGQPYDALMPNAETEMGEAASNAGRAQGKGISRPCLSSDARSWIRTGAPGLAEHSPDWSHQASGQQQLRERHNSIHSATSSLACPPLFPSSSSIGTSAAAASPMSFGVIDSSGAQPTTTKSRKSSEVATMKRTTSPQWTDTATPTTTAVSRTMPSSQLALSPTQQHLQSSAAAYVKPQKGGPHHSSSSSLAPPHSHSAHGMPKAGVTASSTVTRQTVIPPLTERSTLANPQPSPVTLRSRTDKVGKTGGGATGGGTTTGALGSEARAPPRILPRLDSVRHGGGPSVQSSRQLLARKQLQSKQQLSTARVPTFADAMNTLALSPLSYSFESTSSAHTGSLTTITAATATVTSVNKKSKIGATGTQQQQQQSGGAMTSAHSTTVTTAMAAAAAMTSEGKPASTSSILPSCSTPGPVTVMHRPNIGNGGGARGEMPAQRATSASSRKTSAVPRRVVTSTATTQHGPRPPPPWIPQEAMRWHKGHALTNYELSEIQEYNEIYYCGTRAVKMGFKHIDTTTAESLPLPCAGHHEGGEEGIDASSAENGWDMYDDDDDTAAAASPPLTLLSSMLKRHGKNISRISSDGSSIKASVGTAAAAASATTSAAAFDDEDRNYRIILGDHIAYRYEVVDVLGHGTYSFVVRAIDHSICATHPSGGCSMCRGEWRETGKENAGSNACSTSFAAACEHEPPAVAFCAMKIIRNDVDYVNAAVKEIAVLEKINESIAKEHNTVSTAALLDHFMFRGHMVLVFPLFGMDLSELLRVNERRPLPSIISRSLSAQLVWCLHVLHDCTAVIHADIKLENIVLVDRSAEDNEFPERMLMALSSGAKSSIEKSGHGNTTRCSGNGNGGMDTNADDVSSRITLIDHSNSKLVNWPRSYPAQSPFFRAPEVSLKLPYGTAIDMWSVGCAVYELVTGCTLFPESDDISLLRRHLVVLGMPDKEFLDHIKVSWKAYKAAHPYLQGYKPGESGGGMAVHQELLDARCDDVREMEECWLAMLAMLSAKATELRSRQQQQQQQQQEALPALPQGRSGAGISSADSLLHLLCISDAVDCLRTYAATASAATSCSSSCRAVSPTAGAHAVVAAVHAIRLLDFLLGCLYWSAESRLTAAEATYHPYISAFFTSAAAAGDGSGPRDTFGLVSPRSISSLSFVSRTLHTPQDTHHLLSAIPPRCTGAYFIQRHGLTHDDVELVDVATRLAVLHCSGNSSSSSPEERWSPNPYSDDVSAASARVPPLPPPSQLFTAPASPISSSAAGTSGFFGADTRVTARTLDPAIAVFPLRHPPPWLAAEKDIYPPIVRMDSSSSSNNHNSIGGGGGGASNLLLTALVRGKSQTCLLLHSPWSGIGSDQNSNGTVNTPVSSGARHGGGGYSGSSAHGSQPMTMDFYEKRLASSDTNSMQLVDGNAPHGAVPHPPYHHYSNSNTNIWEDANSEASWLRVSSSRDSSSLRYRLNSACVLSSSAGQQQHHPKPIYGRLDHHASLEAGITGAFHGGSAGEEDRVVVVEGSRHGCGGVTSNGEADVLILDVASCNTAALTTTNTTTATTTPEVESGRGSISSRVGHGSRFSTPLSAHTRPLLAPHTPPRMSKQGGRPPRSVPSVSTTMPTALSSSTTRIRREEGVAQNNERRDDGQEQHPYERPESVAEFCDAQGNDVVVMSLY